MNSVLLLSLLLLFVNLIRLQIYLMKNVFKKHTKFMVNITFQKQVTK